jgi:hypothetical protein
MINCEISNTCNSESPEIIPLSRYQKEKTELEKIIDCKNLNILNLQLTLQYEQIKNKIYTDIIQKQTNIKLEDIIKESKNQINIYNFANGNIPIIVTNSSSSPILEIIQKTKSKTRIKKNKKITEDIDIVVETDEEESNEIQTDCKNKQTFRRVKDFIKISEKELDTKLKEDIVKAEKKIEEIVYNNFDVSQKEIIENIEELFEQLQTSRIYKPILLNIKESRRKLLGKLNLIDYSSLVLSHTTRLEDIFSKKKYNKNKINKTINSSLTPLDARFIHYEGYTNISIDIDDVQKFGLVLDILAHHEKQFVPYDNKVFFKSVKNYGLSLFELHECVEKCLINKYGFHNIIYLDRKQNNNKKGSPYSFYSLNTVKGHHRNWKMECRLEDFTLDFIDNVLPYCISLFRKIYKDVFTDNVYREDYMYKSQITEFDCEQLIQNIISLSKPNSLCKVFQQIIVNNCTLDCTETDKFNFYADDKLQQKRLESSIDTEDDISSVFKQLFDGLSTEDALKLINIKS